jgi:hypothetical protein
MRNSKENDIGTENVLILAPTGKDGELTARFLSAPVFAPEICGVSATCAGKYRKAPESRCSRRSAGTARRRRFERGRLRRQPPWSDIPLIVLTSGGGANPTNARRSKSSPKSETLPLIERPIRLMTLVSAVKSALRARRQTI